MIPQSSHPDRRNRARGRFPANLLMHKG